MIADDGNESTVLTTAQVQPPQSHPHDRVARDETICEEWKAISREELHLFFWMMSDSRCKSLFWFIEDLRTKSRATSTGSTLGVGSVEAFLHYFVRLRSTIARLQGCCMFRAQVIEQQEDERVSVLFG